MRKHQVILGYALTLALLAMVVLAGCPAQQDEPAAPEPEAVPPSPDDVPALEEGTADTGADEEATGKAQTLADIIPKWPDSFVMDVTVDDKGTDETHTATMTMKMGDEGASKVRLETPEEKGVFITDYEDMMMYSWDTDSGQGMKMELSEAEAEDAANPYAQVDPDRKIVASETIDGVECWVSEYTDPDGQTVKTWYAKENGMPKKMESDSMVAIYEYSQVGSVSDDAFEIPDGIDLMDFSDMENMPGMPTRTPPGQ